MWILICIINFWIIITLSPLVMIELSDLLFSPNISSTGIYTYSFPYFYDLHLLYLTFLLQILLIFMLLIHFLYIVLFLYINLRIFQHIFHLLLSSFINLCFRINYMCYHCPNIIYSIFPILSIKYFSIHKVLL